MKIERHRKQVMLFLVAVLLPVIVLVVLTLRIVSQERELALKRVADDHRRVAAEIGQKLASRLDGIVRQEASALIGQPQKLARHDYVNPEVIFIAKIDGARLVLPWESGLKTAESSAFVNSTEFGRILGQAENAEFALKNFSLAAERYLRAAAVAGTPVREGYARLQRARALIRLKRERESLSEYEKVLSLSPEVIDEYGIPLSLYAVEPFLKVGLRHGQVLERIGQQVRSGTWLSPAGLYLMKDLVQKIIVAAPDASGSAVRSGAEDLLQKILAQIQTMEQALSLKEDFPRLGLEPLTGTNFGQDKPLWVSYGQKPWLVGRSPLLSLEENLLIAIDFPAFSSALASDADFSSDYPGNVKLVMGLSTDGASLGPAFQGLKVFFGPGAEEVTSKQWSLQRLFYFLALVIVLSVTLFGAYLLWRDVRRETSSKRL
jgi:tetratricopeptide (TPR) repeat protein